MPRGEKTNTQQNNNITKRLKSTLDLTTATSYLQSIKNN